MNQNNFVVLAKEWLEKGIHDIDEACLNRDIPLAPQKSIPEKKPKSH